MDNKEYFELVYHEFESKGGFIYLNSLKKEKLVFSILEIIIRIEKKLKK